MGELESELGDQITVIGVLSPKYTAEADVHNDEQAVRALEIHHPVVCDPELRVWSAFAVSAWPTLVFVDAAGRVAGRHVGEMRVPELRQAVRSLGNCEPPTQIAAPEISTYPRELRYPGKVAVAGDGLIVSDSGNHRILIVTLEGEILQVVGSGAPGWRDGDHGHARFSFPQGIALDADRGVAWVADARNHMIRAIDLRTLEVSTVAGTGEQAVRAPRSGPALEVALSSPWDLAQRGEDLFVAMAGSHQIWRLNLSTGQIGVFAGTGHEAVRDGPRETAWLAQPMSIAIDEDALYVACAESQAIRCIDLTTGTVRTLVGGGLFDWGYVDGALEQALLQHPQGIAAHGGMVLVADTYNDAIRRLDIPQARVATVAGGVRGWLDGPNSGARFWAPSGLALTSTTAYVADTNNHCVRAIDLVAGHVRTVHLRGLGIDSASTVRALSV